MVRTAQGDGDCIAGLVQDGTAQTCLSRWKGFIYVEGHKGENVEEP